MEFTWLDHLFFVSVALAFPYLAISSDSNAPDDGAIMHFPYAKKHLYYTNGLMLWIAAMVAVTCWNYGQRPLSLMGFDWITPHPYLVYAIGVFLLLYFADLAYNALLNPHELKENYRAAAAILPTNFSEYAHYSFLAVSAGLCEEVVYRGFLMGYLKEVLPVPFDQMWIIIGIPAAVFAVSHVYQGWFSVAKIMVLSLLFGLIYWWSASLILVIILHTAVDLISGLVFWGMSDKVNDL